MSLATDTRYRSILVSFLNNEQDGSELVQLLAKPSGGTWAAQRLFPVSLAGDQEVSWDTALPLTLYSVALRYMIGQVAAEGYESSDPDAWTASTAAGSKSTVTTSCADATGLAGTAFAGASTPITLTWACANQNVPFLLEKNIGAGWVTVVADLVATSYPYTVPGAELDTTVQFRVTPKRGSIAGTTTSPISILMTVVVGQPTITSLTFDSSTGVVTCTWSAASNALTYLVEKRIGAGAFATVATISGLTTDYSVVAADVNQTLGFRVTGQNGAVSGAASAIVTVAATMTVGVTTLGTMSTGQSGIGPGTTWTALVTGNTVASGTLTGQQAEWYQDGVLVASQSRGASDTSATYPTGLAYPGSYGITFAVRMRGVAAGPVYGPWSPQKSVLV